MSWILEKNGILILKVKVQPGAKKSEAVSVMLGQDERIKIKIAAPPVDGKANDELVRFLAAELKTSKSKIEIVKGQTSSLKEVWCKDVSLQLAKGLLK